MEKVFFTIKMAPGFRVTLRKDSQFMDFSSIPMVIPMKDTCISACLTEKESGRNKTAHLMDNSNTETSLMEPSLTTMALSTKDK